MTTEIQAYDCKTAADVMAHAAAVRARRKAVFFVPQDPRITPRAQQIEPAKPVVVPPSMPIGATFLFVPDLQPDISAEVTFLDLPWVYKIDDILRAMCAVSGIPKAEILGPRRTKGVTEARQLTMLLCKTLTARSLPEIGRRLGGKDHTTVLHAARKYEWMAPILKAKIPKGAPVSVYAEAVWQLHLAGREAVAA